MKRAIFKKFIIILSLVLFLSGSIFSMAISDIMLDKTRNNLLYTLRMADFSIDYKKNLKEQVDSLKAIENEEATRFTILDFEGNVLADSNLTDYTKVENHSGREEIEEALKTGEGYAKRYSDTMRMPMLYVSCLSGKGDYILRIAVPFSGLLQYTGMLLPAILFSIGTTLGISILLANQFARS
ncbi:MAG TPA: two-component sensor histidine kinase, partial [Lachnospiraceae bacterium]|nr:two-component sensor histidine kinase [Lachnospiraceae bacterium]